MSIRAAWLCAMSIVSHTDFAAACPAWAGSPGSLVAQQVIPLVEKVVPPKLFALAWLSLLGGEGSQSWAQSVAAAAGVGVRPTARQPTRAALPMAARIGWWDMAPPGGRASGSS